MQADAVNLPERTFRSFNLIYQSGMANSGSQGGENAKAIGDEIFLKGWRCRGLLANNPANTLPVTYTMALIKTSVFRTATNLSDAEVTPSYTVLDAVPRLDSTKVTTLKRWTITVKPTQDASQSQQHFDHYVDLKSQKYRFRDLLSNYEGKKENIYFIVYASSFGNAQFKGTGITGKIEFTEELYYKDI